MNNSHWMKIFKTSSIYLFGTVIAKLVSFFLLPLYTKKISTDMYGIYDITIAYASIIVPLIGVNCWQGMLRFVVGEEDEKKALVVRHGWLMLLLSLFALSIGYGCVSFFVPITNKLLVFLYFVFQMIQYFYIYTARGYNKNKVYAFSGIISALSVAVSSIICIYVFDLCLEALYIAQIMSLLSQIIYMECHLHLLKNIGFSLIDVKLLKELYQYCFPESIGTIFNWLLNNANRLIIVAVLGYSANGIYAISNKFLAILNVFMTAFILSFQETIYSAPAEQIEDVGNDVIKIFTKFAGVVVAIVLMGTSIIYPLFVSGEYTEGYILVPLFYLYFLISGITWILSSIVSATKKTQITLYEKMIIGTINFSLMALLIRRVGLSSSPISLFVAETIGIVVFKFFLRKNARCNIIVPVKNVVIDIVLVAIAAVFYFINNFSLNCMAILVTLVVVGIKYRLYIKQGFEKVKRML